MKRGNMMRKETRNHATSTKWSLNTNDRNAGPSRTVNRDLGVDRRWIAATHGTRAHRTRPLSQTEIATDKYPGMV